MFDLLNKLLKDLPKLKIVTTSCLKFDSELEYDDKKIPKHHELDKLSSDPTFDLLIKMSNCKVDKNNIEEKAI